MFFIIASIVLAIISILMVIAILLQEGKAAGLSSSLAGSSETYWSRNKGRSKKGKLERITTICGIAFLVIAILLNVGAFIK